jgi:type II secretory pathway pseudopilin PulG
MGVRVVSALSAAVVVAVALVVAGAALVFLVGQSLQGNVEDLARQRAQLLVERVQDNYKGAANENAVEAINAITGPDDLAQVVVDYAPNSEGSDGMVVEAATGAVGGDQPIST